MAFTFIDLFAGIGGFHAALEPLGGECVFVSEINKNAGKIYKYNWLNEKNISIQEDVRTLLGKSLSEVPNHDVLTAGFPCQPFSKSGHQLGVNETRGTLFYNIIKIVEAKEPKLILLENVRNLVGPKHYEDYLLIVRLLRKMGYAVSNEPTILSPHEIPLHYGGTPQHRERVFIGAVKVGSKRAKNLANIGPLLIRKPFNRFGEFSWNIQQTLDSYKLKIPNDELTISLDKEKALIMWDEFLSLYRKHNEANPPGLPLWSDFWKNRNQVKIPKETPDWKKEFILKNITLFEKNSKWIDKWRNKHSLESFIPSNRKFEWQGKDQESIFHCLVQFRPSGIRVKEPNYVPAFVALTQTPVLGWESRAISEYEASRLQGFPEDFDFNGQKRSESYKQIGNAVHPGSARLVFNALVHRAKSLDLPWAERLVSAKTKNIQPPKSFYPKI